MVWNLKKNLRGELQEAFTNVVDPRISTIMQEFLLPLRAEMEWFRQGQESQGQAITSAIQQQNAKPNGTECLRVSEEHHEAVMVHLKEQDLSLGVAVEGLKEHVSRAIDDLIARQQDPRARSKGRRIAEGPGTSDQVIDGLERSLHEPERAPSKLVKKRELLKEL
jgi:hypothetical protein